MDLYSTPSFFYVSDKIPCQLDLTRIKLQIKHFSPIPFLVRQRIPNRILRVSHVQLFRWNSPSYRNVRKHTFHPAAGCHERAKGVPITIIEGDALRTRSSIFSSIGIPRNDPLMASFGHTFVHTLCRDATLPRDSTNQDSALRCSINPSRCFDFVFESGCLQGRRSCRRNCRLRSLQFVAPSFDYEGIVGARSRFIFLCGKPFRVVRLERTEKIWEKGDW